MLSDLLRQKLTHYFDVLDFNSNGVLERDDFIGVADNLGILWGLDIDTPKLDKLKRAFDKQWVAIKNAVQAQNSITLDQWLDYADSHIVSSKKPDIVLQWTYNVISFFDTDKDGFISMMEYVDFFVGYHIEVRYSAKSFRHLDLNSDGLISKEELAKAITQFFTSDDPDSPGNWLFGFWSK